jgi:glycosyltransferase involved in cell wall biosynthesis
MRICFVTPEVFAWGYHGGFGFLTRTLGRELARRGHEVSVVTPRRGEQREVEEIDGMTVYGFDAHGDRPHPLQAVASRLDSLRYYREAEADVYHSQAVSYNTVAAQRATPDAFHAITFQDPYDLGEWRRISLVDPRYRLTPVFRSRLILENRVLAGACRRADSLYAQARLLVERAVRLFRLDKIPGILPNPVEIPEGFMRKANEPTVCFLGRWDPQKRVEIFFELAREFSDVRFIAMGRSNDAASDARLRRACRGIPNLLCPGFVSEGEKSRILEGSWALVNTSVREALPVSFLEALAHEAVIVSGEDPDRLTSRYGYRVEDSDYAGALRSMLEDGGRRERGRRGRRHVELNHELGMVVDRHEEVYEGLLGGGG